MLHTCVDARWWWREGWRGNRVWPRPLPHAALRLSSLEGEKDGRRARRTDRGRGGWTEGSVSDVQVVPAVTRPGTCSVHLPRQSCVIGVASLVLQTGEQRPQRAHSWPVAAGALTMAGWRSQQKSASTNVNQLGRGSRDRTRVLVRLSLLHPQHCPLGPYSPLSPGLTLGSPGHLGDLRENPTASLWEPSPPTGSPWPTDSEPYLG